MAMNFDAVLRLAAKVTGLQDIDKLSGALGSVEGVAKSARRAFTDVTGSATWQAAAAGAAVFTAGIGLAVKSAIDFEASMSDVRKVVDGLETPEAFREISDEVLNLSNQMPIAAKGFADIYAAAGQSGIAREELEGFAVLVAKVSVAFNMTADEAGKSLAQMKVALGLTTEELGQLADAMNHVSNNTGATAANLVEFMGRVGSFGKIAGLQASETLAFGAAMIQAGVETNVAATSFRNMVKALSSGPSMTEKQVDALRRLGYSMASAAQIESELTRAAETESRRRVDDARYHKDEIIRVAQEQSDRRIEIARDETDKLSKELNRRFRDEMRIMEDGWEDEARGRENAARDRANAQIKALQRQERNEITAAQKRAKAANADATAAVDRIRDSYEARVDAIRNSLDKELLVQRRAARDRQQVIRDQVDDRKDLEMKAIRDRVKAVEAEEKQYMDAQKTAAEQRFKQIEEREKLFVEQAKVDAKKTGEDLARASMQGFADRMQQDATGTIMEVLQRIKNLPEEQKVSVLQDLFGGEARGLAPMIANLDELKRVMLLATDATSQAGSVNKEYETRLQTTESQMQLVRNQMENLGTVIGQSVLPEILELTGALKPLIQGITDFAKTNPEITRLVIAVGGIATAVILAIPFIAALIASIATIKTALAGGAIAAALSTFVGAFKFAFTAGLIPLLKGVVAWVGATFIPALLAFFSGPVGWTVLAVAAVVAMAVAFREPLMNFVSWLWNWGQPVRDFWAGLWNGVVQLATTSIGKLGEFFRAWGAEIAKIWSGDFSTLLGIVDGWWKAVQGIWAQIPGFFAGVWSRSQQLASAFFKWLTSTVSSGFKAVTTAIDNLFVKPWILIWNKGIREPVTAAQEWLRSSVFEPLGKGFVTYVTEPITNAWRAVTEFLQSAMANVGNFVQGLWTAMVGSIQNTVRGMLTFIVTAANRVRSLINFLISAYNRLASAVGGTQLDLIGEITIPPFAQSGVVDRPTLALVGDGNEREYIIGESKMQEASSRFLGGARGADVIPSSSASVSTAGRSTPQVNITTGPVMQQQDGSRWVSMDDFERGLQQVAEQVVGTLRTPQARTALGWN